MSWIFANKIIANNCFKFLQKKERLHHSLLNNIIDLCNTIYQSKRTLGLSDKLEKIGFFLILMRKNNPNCKSYITYNCRSKFYDEYDQLVGDI